MDSYFTTTMFSAVKLSQVFCEHPKASCNDYHGCKWSDDNNKCENICNSKNLTNCDSESGCHWDPDIYPNGYCYYVGNN